jgi:hypothetical protein
MTTKRSYKKWSNPKLFRLLMAEAFSVDQDIPWWVAPQQSPPPLNPDGINIIPTSNVQPKSFPHFLGLR